MPEIYAYMTNFTKSWLKYQNFYEDLTKADLYMNFCFYRVSQSQCKTFGGWSKIIIIIYLHVEVWEA